MTRPRPFPLLLASALALLGCTGPDPGSTSVDTATPSSTGTGGDPTGDAPTGDDPAPATTGPAPDPTTGAVMTTTVADTTAADTTAAPTICGDGVLDPGEGCDAGPANDPYAACTDLCQLNVCGDGKVLVGVEACDEGPANVDTGYCRSDCELGVCGDGFVFAGQEECDAGDANGPAYNQCDEHCTVNRCGDGVLDPGHEQCDEGDDNGAGVPGADGFAGCRVDCGFAGRRIFLSSRLFTGDMGGRAGADLACQDMSALAGLEHPEKYRALLADAEGSPGTFVDPDPGGLGLPFILPAGLVVASSYPALFQSGPGDGITTTELGDTLYKEIVWTNLNPVGDPYLKDPAASCDNWTSEDPLKSARTGLNAVPPGDPAALATWKSKKQWVSATNRNCKDSQRIYCIEAL